MRIHHVLDGISIIITNEEKHFMAKNDNQEIHIPSLDDHDKWVAQNLVRKGVYTLSNDSKHIIRVDDARHGI